MSFGIVRASRSPNIKKPLDGSNCVRYRAQNSINRILECANDRIGQLMFPVFVEEPVYAVPFALRPQIKLRVYEFPEYHCEIKKVVTVVNG